MNRRLLFVLCFALMLFSCKSKNSSNEEKISREEELNIYFEGVDDIVVLPSAQIPLTSVDSIVQVTLNMNNLSIFDAGASFKFLKAVPLQTSLNNLIGSIDKLIYTDSTIFILDRDLGKRVYSFTLSGEFIASIGFAGRGPEEYIEPTDIFFNKDTKTLSVWDQYSHRIVEYTRDGKFLSDRRIPLRFLRCEYNPQSKGLWCSNMTSNSAVESIRDYNLAAITKGFDTINALFDHNRYTMNYVPIGTNMKIVNDEFYYHPHLSDTIYKLTNRGVEPKFHIDIKARLSLPDNFMEVCQGDYEQFNSLFRDKNYPYFESEYFITDRYLYLVVYNSSFRHLFQYGLNSKQIKFFLPTVYDEGFKLGHLQVHNLLMSNIQFASYKDGVCCIPLEVSMLSALSKDERKILNLDNIDEDANPVLFFIEEL